jgi:pimeloyl-ACP methyl ester carboxylesterase
MTGEGLSVWCKDGGGEPQQPMMIAGGGGTRIAAYEYGDANGPEILLVHGFSQSHLAWAKQYKSPTLQQFRIVVIDLRGHGASEKPTDVGSYNDSRVWAQDIHAVLRAKDLKKPLVGVWSYGGFIISDYVREYGDGQLAGIVFVGAVTQMGTQDAKGHYGAGMKVLLGMLDARQEINIPATAQFIRTAVAGPIPAEEFEAVLAYNMAVSPEIRSALLSRVVDSNDALARITVPVLIVQGEQDSIALVAAAEHIGSKIRHAKKSYYPKVAHCPFMEDSDRFNRELAAMRVACQV